MVLLFESVVTDHSKEHPVAASGVESHAHLGVVVHHSAGLLYARARDANVTSRPAPSATEASSPVVLRRALPVDRLHDRRNTADLDELELNKTHFFTSIQ